MPKNNVTDPITDQEIAFVHLVRSGTMTDRQAAEAVGLNPDTAAYIKSKPRVRAYMLEHCATVQQQLVEQDTQELRRFNVSRDQILTRLWEIANLDPERTRNSMSAQVKALSMIVAIEGLIPDRRAVSAQSKPAPAPVNPPFYVSKWMRNQQNQESVDPQPPPAPEPEAPQEEVAAEPPSAPGGPDGPLPEPTPGPTPDLSEPSFFAGPLNPSQTTSSLPRVPMADYFAPDTRVPFSIDKNRFGRRR